MTLSRDEVERLTRERETLRGLLREAENGRAAPHHYDGMKIDPVDVSIEATRAKLAAIEAALAARGAEG